MKKPDGSYELITAETEGANGGELTDAMSVLGQFEFQAGSGGGNVGGAGPSAVLGKFFATGAAAQVLAQGFANKLSGGGAADANSQ